MDIQNAQQILDVLANHRDLLYGMGVRTLGLFGSYARGNQQTGSDVDLLVHLTDEVSLLRYVQIKLYLETLLGKRVDLVEEPSLKARLRPVVMREVRYVERLSPISG